MDFYLMEVGLRVGEMLRPAVSLPRTRAATTRPTSTQDSEVSHDHVTKDSDEDSEEETVQSRGPDSDL